MFPRDMVCLRNISVDTLHKEDTEDNNNNSITYFVFWEGEHELFPGLITDSSNYNKSL